MGGGRNGASERPRGFPTTGVVWSTDGVIVTAHHVIHREASIRVGLEGGQEASATLVGRYPLTDLAVPKFEAKGLRTASWAESDSVKVGHLVLALGRPEEYVRATLVIVSAFGGGWVTGGGRVDHYLQTDAMMFPGFTGGALVNIRGLALGVNMSGLIRGLSITVPNATIKRVVEGLLGHECIQRGYLGVGTRRCTCPGPWQPGWGRIRGCLSRPCRPAAPRSRSACSSRCPFIR